MCLAAPPTNRNPQYAVPYTFPIVKDASPFKGADSSSPAAGRRSDNRQPRGQTFDNIGNAFEAPLDLPKTPPPVDVVGSFSGALGPTGLSPTAHYSHEAGVVPGVDPEKVVVPLVPTRTSHYSRVGTPAARAVTSARKVPAPLTKQRRRRVPQRPGKTATDKERLFVKHDYHDLSADPDGLPGDDTAKSNGRSASSSENLANESFPVKIRHILEESTDDPSLNHIICWQPHGRAFKIRNPKLFTERIMPRYFPKMKKLTSLQRQFNLYGFERLTREGPDAGAYYHEAFLRYRPGLSARRMVRRRIKGTGYKAASNPEAEPDLYALPFMQEEMTTKRGDEREEAASATHCHQQQLITFPGFPLCSDNGGATKDQDTVAGIVTESTKSGSFSSYDSSSSEETSSHHEKALKRWVSSPLSSVTASTASAFPMPIQFLPQAVVHSNNPSPMDARRNNQDQHRDSIISSPSMDDFLPQPEVTQDLLLGDFFSTNDVTPLVPGFDSTNTDIPSTSPIGASSSVSDHEQQQDEDHAILLEFADMWESSSLHPK